MAVNGIGPPDDGDRNATAGSVHGGFPEGIGQFEPVLHRGVALAVGLDAAPVEHRAEAVLPDILGCQISDLALDDLADQGDQADTRSQMLSHLVPEQFKGNGEGLSPNLYLRLLQLTDYISGMTDSYAVSIYKKITGISLPGG